MPQQWLNVQSRAARRSVRAAVSAALFATAGLGLTSCDKSSTTPAAPSPEEKPRVVALGPQQALLVSTGEDLARGMLRFIRSPSTPSIRTGDVVVTAQTGGALGRVESVATAADTILLQTGQVPLEEVVSEGTLASTVDITLGQLAASRGNLVWGAPRLVRLANGAHLTANGIDLSGTQILAGQLCDSERGSTTERGCVKVDLRLGTGTVDLRNQLEFAAVFHDFRLREISFIGQTQLTYKVTVVANIEGSINRAGRVPIGRVAYPFTGIVAGIPVAGEVLIEVEAVWSLDVGRVSFTAGFQGNPGGRVGVIWRNGQTELVREGLGDPFQPIPLALTADRRMGTRVGIESRATVYLYHAKGPYVAPEAYLDLTGQLNTGPSRLDYELFAGLDMHYGIEWRALSRLIVDVHRTAEGPRHRLFAGTLPLESTPPTARMTLQSGSQSTREGGVLRVTAGFNSRATVSLDATRSTPGSRPIASYRWFSNGTAIREGATESMDFAPGNYDVRVVVADNTGLSHGSNPTLEVTAPPLPTYTVTATPSPPGGGTVTGAGTYTSGQKATLKAFPANGYDWVRWTENGAQISTADSIQITVTANRPLVAVFQARPPQMVRVTTEANPTAGGSITGGGNVPKESSVTVTATPATGFRLDRWTEGGVEISKQPSITFKATVDRYLVAHFASTAPTSSQLVVRPTLSGSTYTAVSGASYRAQLWGSERLDEVSASGADFNFGTRPFGSYRVDIYQGGILIGQQTISLTANSASPISVALLPKRDLRVTAYYSNGTTRLPAGYTVRIRDLSPSPAIVASGTTSGSGQVTLQVFPTDDSNGNGYTVQVLTSGGSLVGSEARVQVANSSTVSQETVTTSVPVPAVTNGTLVVRPTLSGSTYTAVSGASYRAQLWGSERLDEVSASGADFNFGTRPFGSYRVDIYQGGILIGQQTISLTASSASPIPVALLPKRDLRVTAYYSNGTTRLPAGYTVRIRDLTAPPATVASGTTNGSGQVTLQVFPTDDSNGNGYTVQVLTSGGSLVGSEARVQVANSSTASQETVTTSVTELVGSIRSTLRNIDGNSAAGSGTRYLLHTDPIRTEDGSNPVTLTSIPVGRHLLEGFFTGTFFGREFWTSQQVTVSAGQTSNVTLTRDYPYATVVIKNDATGAVLAAGQSVPAGTRLRSEVTVHNNVPGTNLSSRVRFIFDKSRTASYDYDQSSSSQTVSGSGGTRLYIFVFTPTAAGQYHYALAVTTAVSGSYILTDSWTWTQTITRQ